MMTSKTRIWKIFGQQTCHKLFFFQVNNNRHILCARMSFVHFVVLDMKYNKGVRSSLLYCTYRRVYIQISKKKVMKNLSVSLEQHFSCVDGMRHVVCGKKNTFCCYVEHKCFLCVLTEISVIFRELIYKNASCSFVFNEFLK